MTEQDPFHVLPCSVQTRLNPRLQLYSNTDFEIGRELIKSRHFINLDSGVRVLEYYDLGLTRLFEENESCSSCAVEWGISDTVNR